MTAPWETRSGRKRRRMKRVCYQWDFIHSLHHQFSFLLFGVWVYFGSFGSNLHKFIFIIILLSSRVIELEWIRNVGTHHEQAITLHFLPSMHNKIVLKLKTAQFRLTKGALASDQSKFSFSMKLYRVIQAALYLARFSHFRLTRPYEIYIRNS